MHCRFLRRLRRDSGIVLAGSHIAQSSRYSTGTLPGCRIRLCRLSNVASRFTCGNRRTFFTIGLLTRRSRRNLLASFPSLLLGIPKCAVQVVQRERDSAEVYTAVGRVHCACAIGHRSRGVIGRNCERELARNVSRLQTGLRCQHLHAGKINFHRASRGVLVLERQARTCVRRCR